MEKFGWDVKFVDVDDHAGVEAAIDDKTRCVFTESLANRQRATVAKQLANLLRVAASAAP